MRLDDLCSSITDGKHGDCVDEPSSGYYFISVKDVRGGKINYEDARQITKTDFDDTHRRTRLEPNDILITNSGLIGRLAFMPDAEIVSRTTFQKSVAIIKPIGKVVLPRFLYCSIEFYRDTLEDLSGGTAQKNLLLGDLRKFQIPIPPLLTQRKIAAILSAYDDLIENNTRRIALLEKMAEEVYREWFVRLRFPGHESVAVKNGVPDGWEETTLGEVCTFNVRSLNTKNYPETINYVDIWSCYYTS